ncbi:MAG TPA: hypothetical protein VGM82_00185 [Gemmatimonadaceae bacterium]|jgi:hypothetical protein
MDPELQPVHWPIIYVRGYAMTQKEIDETAADAFCGFNLGSTQYRAQKERDKPPRQYIFQSPVVRLQSEHGYRDVYEEGRDLLDLDWTGKRKYNGGLDRRSIIVYRYYDEVSSQFGTSEKPDVERFARGLNELILKIKTLTVLCQSNATTDESFRCYLVAHSMGGLVCRAFLQNPAIGDAAARKCVDKFFTYATPHNGIDVAGVNVPDWLSLFDVKTFSRDFMAQYLAISPELRDRHKDRVDVIPESAFPSSRIFTMVGTNRGDYEAALGLSRTFVGHGSDGLVRIDNAGLWGVDAEGNNSAPTAVAYAYRSHSGRFGIVNGEEAYQNLTRFLFGDLRVEMWLDIAGVNVPQELEDADKQGRLDGLYQIEVLVAPRGARWFLSRRIVEEDSVACRTHAEIKAAMAAKRAESVHLSTVFLADSKKVDPERPTLAYSLTLRVRVPDYEVDRRFWPNTHYEGANLFDDTVAIEIAPPTKDRSWVVTHGWQSDDVGQSTKPVLADNLRAEGDRIEIDVPFWTNDLNPPRSPGIHGQLRFVVTQWNDPAPGRQPVNPQ